jgi:fucose permease
VFRGPLDRQGWLIVLAMAFYVGAEMIVSTRIVVFLRMEHQWGPEQASWYLTLFFLGLMGGRAANLAWHLPLREWQTLVLANVLALLSFVAGLSIHPLGLALCGIFMSVVFPTMVAFAGKIRPEHSDKIVSYGITGVGMVLVTMHFTVGWIAELTSMTTAMTVGIGLLAVVLVVLMPLKSAIPEGKTV